MRLSGVASLLCAAAVSINASVVERSPRNLVMKILPLGGDVYSLFISSAHLIV